MKLIFTAVFSILIFAGIADACTVKANDTFVKIDTNGDGVLTYNEVSSQPDIVRFTNLYYRDSFYLADINSDGVLNIQEYLANEEDVY